MSRTLDALREAERKRRTRASAPAGARPFQVVTIASNKGGVGKTTFATNLAVYARALREELPILLVGLDDQGTVDQMFRIGGAPAHANVAVALRRGNLADAIQLGQYGVQFVSPATELEETKRAIQTPWALERALRASGFRGLVVIDTKSDLEILTRNALAAADLAVVVVKDLASLDEADKIHELMRGWGRTPEHVRVLLSLVDPRVRFQEGEPDVHALLLAELGRRGMGHFASFVSRSPEVEALHTNPQGRIRAILHGAAGTRVDAQMRWLAREVLESLDALVAGASEATSAPALATPRAEPAIGGPPRETPEPAEWRGGTKRSFWRYLLRSNTARA